MLYVTTRSRTDSYTAYRALHEGVASDGGEFLPIRLPQYTHEQLEAIMSDNFNETVARVLNLFFSVRLTGWDIEFAIGRKPIRLLNMGRKITVAELWRNTEADYNIAARRIYARLCDNLGAQNSPNGWSAIAIRIALLFGVYGELRKQEIYTFDAAASGKDMQQVMALWYARNMGLPVGRILCGCNENCWIWDLTHKGELTFTAPVQTCTPDLDRIPSGIERLVYGTLGQEETIRYLGACADKASYCLSQEQLQKLNSGMFSSVVGGRRVMDLIASVYRTNQYLIDPYTAISYGTLQDYRAKTGENKLTVLFSEGNPEHFADVISQATGLPMRDIKK